jgi:hypothetical protein
MWNMWWTITNEVNKIAKLEKNLKYIKWKINVDNFISLVKRNPKSTLFSLATWLWISTALFFNNDEQKQIEKDLLTWAWATTPSNWIQSSQQDINPTHANKESTETLDWTKEDLNKITSDIRGQLESWDITKDEARKALTTVKEFANFNFETSISDNLKMKWLDNSFEARWELANKLWIEWYEWTYNQNIQMLNSIRYMDNKEIQELLSK